MNTTLFLIKWYLIGAVFAFCISIGLILTLKKMGYTNHRIKFMIQRNSITKGIFIATIKSWLTCIIFIGYTIKFTLKRIIRVVSEAFNNLSKFLF